MGFIRIEIFTDYYNGYFQGASKWTKLSDLVINSVLTFGRSCVKMLVSSMPRSTRYCGCQILNLSLTLFASLVKWCRGVVVKRATS